MSTLPAVSTFLLLLVFPQINKAEINHGQQHAMASTVSSDPYLDNYVIEDSCQFKLCGPDYLNEFAGSNRHHPLADSCSGACDNLAHRLADSRFKKEFLWAQCTDMCAEKYPIKEYR